MKAATLVGVLVLAMSFSANAQVSEELYGTWRLVSFTWQVVGTGESSDLFGKAPYGFLNYGRDGRMFAIIVKENRPKPADLAKITDQERAELFRTVIAYGGTFKVDGSRVVHNVDISWNENWTGTAQVRNFRIEGRRLIISVDPQVGTEGKLITAVLTWEKLQ
ncbi:MAG TPA: lipocalin-like domain-containing protein [Candidatus Methylomirabilis sp.]|nr:lipocalin-like domain-containing protein [Candidatus Methylomirabilis sp.]HSB77865.1 lipocalin-like domain-containing protein [Candidatus Methylomirabilis sp.]HSC69802.1 lipocalin-like domain-containing protein [Candidatus Methylomirabilis sp.]